MAGNDFTEYGEKIEIAPGLIKHEYAWGKIFEGNRDTLIAAGIAESAWFPGEPGQKKTVGRGSRNERVHKVHRLSGRRFSVTVHHTPEERRFCWALNDERKAIARLPKSAADYREKVIEGARKELVRSIVIQVLGPWGGYQYTKDSAEKIIEACREIERLLRSEKVVFDKAARDSAIGAIKAETAKENPALQGFLAGLAEGMNSLEDGDA